MSIAMGRAVAARTNREIKTIGFIANLGGDCRDQGMKGGKLLSQRAIYEFQDQHEPARSAFRGTVEDRQKISRRKRKLFPLITGTLRMPSNAPPTNGDMAVAHRRECNIHRVQLFPHASRLILFSVASSTISPRKSAHWLFRTPQTPNNQHLLLFSWRSDGQTGTLNSGLLCMNGSIELYPLSLRQPSKP